MRPLLIVSALFGFSSVAFAGLDPETKSPYQLRIVLSFADHPDFTEFFRQELKRELQTNLQAALGPIGSVEVIDPRAIDRDKWEALWLQVEQKGLESLDSFNIIGGGKTHFLRIDCQEGQYLLQSRQVDGTAGFVTPIVRRNRTYSRSFISRLAGLMIAKDFGVVATLDPGGGQNAYMRLKAGALGPMDHWVKKGEVFAVLTIRQVVQRVPAAKGARGPAKTESTFVGKREEGVLLKVVAEPRDGVVSCQVFDRYKGPLPTKGIIGYRCVKLGTTTSPLRLQLTEANGTLPKGGSLQVYARGEDFPTAPKQAEQTTLQDNVFVSKERFSNVAFVGVMVGSSLIAQIPVAILDDRVEVRSIHLDPNAELRDRVDADLRSIRQRITDGRVIQVYCFEQISALESSNMKPMALERGQSVLKSLDAAASDMQEEIDKLHERIDKASPAAKARLADCDQQLKTLRSKQDELRQHLEALKVVIAEDNDPMVTEKKKKVQEAIRRAELLVTQAEYDQALKAYEEALAEVQKEPMQRQRIEAPYQALKKAWAQREGNAKHAQARQFIGERWPKLSMLQDFAKQMPEARKSFETCKELGDRLAINKMLLDGLKLVPIFQEELKKQIDSAMEEEDKKALEKYQKVSEDLQKLLRDMEAALAKK